MEYFAGSLFTLLTMLIVARLVRSPKNQIKKIKTNFNQSRQHELVKDFLPFPPRKKLNSQAIKHHKNKYMRIVFINNTAYWIEDSIFYTADFVDGKIVEETKKIVDTIGMDKVELDKMIFIVDRLTEGLSDDSSNSGN
jgi:hypothetical protein